MICPKCKVECKHPCWIGPVGEYNKIPLYACGKCPEDLVYFISDEGFVIDKNHIPLYSPSEDPQFPPQPTIKQRFKAWVKSLWF